MNTIQQPPLFHIHVDAAWLTADFETYLREKLAFVRTDFVGPDGGDAEPVNHLTLKLSDPKVFRECFAQVVQAAQRENSMAGYVEGEFIAQTRELPFQPYNPNIPIPFELELGALPAGSFRESEVHVTVDAEHTEPRLLTALRDMGLLTIYSPKPWGVALVFTAQGNRPVIAEITNTLYSYLEKTGGAQRCRIKEERIALWWMSDPNVPLPHVVQSIKRCS